jgi:PAS domain S-box-containing protein
MTGYWPEEAMAMTLEQALMPASFKAAVLLLTQEQAANHEKGSPSIARLMELEYRMKNGASVWTEVRLTFIHHEDGHGMEIMGVARDIMDRKRAEDALNASERSYADLVKAATEPIMMFDRQGILQSINPAAEYALGYHSAELIGKHVQNILAPESVSKTLQELTLIFLGWQRVPFELHLMRKDKHLLIMEATPRLLRRDSEAAFVQILCRNIAGSSHSSSISA